MRLIDADKAKAELLRIARDIHDCCGFYDGLKAGYQSAADRLDTIPTAEKECDKGHWIDITFDASMCSVCQTTQEAVDEGRNKGVIHNETLFNKNNIKFLLLKKLGKYYKSYFEAEKHLKEDYEYLTGE